MKKLDYLDIGLEVEVDGVKYQACKRDGLFYLFRGWDWPEIYADVLVLGLVMRQIAKLSKWKIRR